MVHEVSRMPRVMLFVSIAALLMSGCVSMGKSECLHGGWQIIGYEDCARGYPGSRIGLHRKACAQRGRNPRHDRLDFDDMGRPLKSPIRSLPVFPLLVHAVECYFKDQSPDLARLEI
jgi:hypothetical protein